MSKPLTKRQWFIFAAVLALLVACSLWQNQRLRAVQLEEKKALYAERLRIAQVILENELLAAAYMVTTDEATRKLARSYIERSPQ